MMIDRPERMVSFRLRGTMNNRLPNVGEYRPGETVHMRVSVMAALFPDHKQVLTTLSLIYNVFDDDWAKVEKAFRSAYLGAQIRLMGSAVTKAALDCDCVREKHIPGSAAAQRFLEGDL